jgi:hypothetical protein
VAKKETKPLDAQERGWIHTQQWNYGDECGDVHLSVWFSSFSSHGLISFLFSKQHNNDTIMRYKPYSMLPPRLSQKP